MANSRILNDTAIDGQIEETTAWKDFLSLIKIGIVNSNLITTFTGMWLALHISGLSFRQYKHRSSYINRIFSDYCGLMRDQ